MHVACVQNVCRQYSHNVYWLMLAVHLTANMERVDVLLLSALSHNMTSMKTTSFTINCWAKTNLRRRNRSSNFLNPGTGPTQYDKLGPRMQAFFGGQSVTKSVWRPGIARGGAAKLMVQRLGVGLVIERSLVRLPTGRSLSSQLGQLSLPSLRGR